MYLKYDELELLELFLSEPKSLRDDFCEGKIEYITTSEDGFQLTLWIDIYEMKCSLFLMYQEKDILSVSFSDVTEMKKKDNLLKFFSKDTLLCNVYFREYIFIEID